MRNIIALLASIAVTSLFIVGGVSIVLLLDLRSQVDILDSSLVDLQEDLAALKAGYYSGLVGYWSFDDGIGTTASDTSGNNYDGSIYGAAWENGKFDDALRFDGMNDYVSMPTLFSSDTDSLTAMAWIKSSLDHASYILYHGEVLA